MNNKIYLTYIILKDANHKTLLEGFGLRIDCKPYGNKTDMYILLSDDFYTDIESTVDLIESIKKCIQ